MPISEYLAGLRTRIGTELVLMPCAAGVIRDAQGRILIQRRSDNGEWSVPGGAIDPDEQPAQACVREVYEETGLVVRPMRLLSVETHPRTTYPNGDVAQAIVAVFACTIVGGELGSIDGESTDLVFVAPDELPESGFVDRFLPSVYESDGSVADFAWDDAWLTPASRTGCDGSTATT